MRQPSRSLHSLRPLPRLTSTLTLVIALATALAACTAAGSGTSTPEAAAAPTLSNPVAEGQRLAEGFFSALQSGDPAKVSAVMAPEARIARANGDVVVRDDYLNNLPVIAQYTINKIGANQHGDVLVVTYHVMVDEIIDGVQQPTKEAPRMTVFQWQDGAWMLVAHANFGAINSPPNP